MSKSFNALASMQLVETGQLELDAPVQRYLPWFQVADPTASAALTVWQLLNQTSGFATATGLTLLDSPDQGADALEAGVRALRTVQLAHPPGAKYEYSNTNYAVLGLIIQQVSGMSYETYVQQHILAPLALHHSFWASCSSPTVRRQPCMPGARGWSAKPDGSRLIDWGDRLAINPGASLCARFYTAAFTPA